MNFLDKISALLPLWRKDKELEYFFAFNIGVEKLTAALWVIEGSELKILETASESYASNDEIANIADRLLDQVLGMREIEPQKILFGVPDSWLSDDNLKDEYLKLLRNLVKELELIPMAYVAISHSLIHFLEKDEGIPTTAILVGFEEHHLTVTVVRAGKLDGVKIIQRGENSGADIEKALLTFTGVETLPSKILIYGTLPSELKSQLLSFHWLSKLSFLHLPKIDVLKEDVEIKSVCLAGASEINENISYTDYPIQKEPEKQDIMVHEPVHKEEVSQTNFGFVVGDVADYIKQKNQQVGKSAEEVAETKVVAEEGNLEIEDFENEEIPPPVVSDQKKRGLYLKRFIPQSFSKLTMWGGIIAILFLLVGAYLLLVKADVKIFVEPKVLEKDAQVVADPRQKNVDEDAKIIPGQVVDTEVSGSAKDQATGKKQIGDPAKGTVIIRNKTDDALILSKGTVLTANNGLKFILDLTVTVASRSADLGTYGSANVTVTAKEVGADGNLPSDTDFTIAGYSSDKAVAKSEGNFSGGTSKDVTVVSSGDQSRLLASLASDLRRQAQQKLQEKLPDKKILEEGLSEEIIRKSYSKDINDQAQEFSLNLTIKYHGTAFEDKDLKLIVSKLVTTEVPDSFELDLSQTETQADVSKLEKDGRLIFLARFKAKLMPKIDTEKLKNKIKFKSPSEVANIVREMDNVLGSEIKMSPNLPSVLQRLPLFSRNIKIEVGLK